MTVTINGTTGITTPAVTNNGAYTGDGVSFADNTPSNTLVTDTSGNVGIGTASPFAIASTNLTVNGTSGSTACLGVNGTRVGQLYASGSEVRLSSVTSVPLVFYTADAETMRIKANGTFLVAKTESGPTQGLQWERGSHEYLFVQNDSTQADQSVVYVNRGGADGHLIAFRHENSTEGNISVSGTTVSYNGGHLSRYAQTATPKDDSLLKGTVLSNLDEMNQYVDVDGNPVANEQLNKVKVSDVEGDVNVAGVFVTWSHDEEHNVDEINMAMTGDMIIRIAQSVTVQKGDLLMSAGDGTAKPQGDDIVRAKTVAKVTSNHVTCTYADGSYCVPCVLMAC